MKVCFYCGNHMDVTVLKMHGDRPVEICDSCNKWKGPEPPRATDGPLRKNIR